MSIATDRLSTKPYLIDAKEAHEGGVVNYQNNGAAKCSFVDFGEHEVPLSNQYDLTQATLFGLNERLTSAATSPVVEGGQTLRDLFNDEWERYSSALMLASNAGDLDYGVYAYYRDSNSLVRYAPEYWHKVVSIASNSKLITDVSQEMSWLQIREQLKSVVLGVAGCSVGSNILHSSVLDLRPDVLKVADKSMYKMENINRVRLSFWDIVASEDLRKSIADLTLSSKALTVAKQVYSIDPFVYIYEYSEGINSENVGSFFDGNDEEPPINMVVEEIDDPRIKILLREEARKRKLPLLMMTDVGSSIQIDLMRYDLDDSLPLAHGVSDDYLKSKMEAVYDSAGYRKVFFEFVDALIGEEYRTGELKRIIEGSSEVPTSTIIPQLGSTAVCAGAVAAELIARVRLGHSYPGRAYFNKQTLEVKIG